MSVITIEQTPDQAKLAFELQTHAEIESVRLQRARLGRGGALEGGGNLIALRFSRRARKLEGPEDVLRLEILFRMEGREEQRAAAARERAAEPFVLIESVWVLDYRLLEGYRPSPAAVKAFKDGNAIFNCWPYFREFVQNSISRMNLPPLTIPLLRIMPKLARNEWRGATQPDATGIPR